jgi:hypothetical protein
MIAAPITSAGRLWPWGPFGTKTAPHSEAGAIALSVARTAYVHNAMFRSRRDYGDAHDHARERKRLVSRPRGQDRPISNSCTTQILSSCVKDSFGRIERYQGVAGRQGRNRRLPVFARLWRRRPSCAHGFRATGKPTTKEQITTNSDYRKENDASAATTADAPPAFAGLAVAAPPLRA